MTVDVGVSASRLWARAVDGIIDLVAAAHGITAIEIKSERRTALHYQARAWAIWFCCRHAGYPALLVAERLRITRNTVYRALSERDLTVALETIGEAATRRALMAQIPRDESPRLRIGRPTPIAWAPAVPDDMAASSPSAAVSVGATGASVGQPDARPGLPVRAATPCLPAFAAFEISPAAHRTDCRVGHPDCPVTAWDWAQDGRPDGSIRPRDDGHGLWGSPSSRAPTGRDHSRGAIAP